MCIDCHARRAGRGWLLNNPSVLPTGLGMPSWLQGVKQQ
jgi:hypothetical protein